jgi:hypothetical protein
MSLAMFLGDMDIYRCTTALECRENLWPSQVQSMRIFLRQPCGNYSIALTSQLALCRSFEVSMNFLGGKHQKNIRELVISMWEFFEWLIFVPECIWKMQQALGDIYDVPHQIVVLVLCSCASLVRCLRCRWSTAFHVFWPEKVSLVKTARLGDFYPLNCLRTSTL